MKKNRPENGIPIAPSLPNLIQKDNTLLKVHFLKKRLLQISLLSIGVAILISLIAKILVLLINLVTNIFFYGSFDISFHSPAENNLGLFVIILPVIGGVLVGLMALFGSKAIRGHGIPEAMEQILTNHSKIKPAIAFLKPISSAIAIGSGGPFGAEGPIIATGGALGSTIGQLFKITSNERKIILAAGATAGMSAIFGTPIAAIFLAIELLLFEFSPKAILPVALACITGAAGHHLLFESGPVFPMPNLESPTNFALAIYSAIGIVIGFISLGLTKVVYWVEDVFEKLPIHWMWWPALGGLAVGIIGYFFPNTLGVGYNNIVNMLSGKIPLTLMLSLCFFKFLSWAIALGSGTSGGTLAPLLTIGGAAGAILGTLILMFFPEAGISIPMAALIGMSSMFAGASRAYLTSIIFALESTMQSQALLPLLAACTASYLVSFFFMENTIMTEKIARRGIYTPDAYEPDILRRILVSQVLGKGKRLHPQAHTIEELLLKNVPVLSPNDPLSKAVELMAIHGEEVLPIMSSKNSKEVFGILSYNDVLHAYELYHKENQEAGINLSLKRQRIKIMVMTRKFRR
ncbi:chloride channel protein [Pedobacter gandavensis]|uniref:Chloride channel protein n=1 Tax=Pedobacter gandavensis TaxID=2679963 RepID=A0ABR6ESN7_9SPHI|nr:chloride channel protein [Pedobacter gandavensis]MBB2148283.1 chloride channel protein [Pedobacter gandavensis]